MQKLILNYNYINTRLRLHEHTHLIHVHEHYSYVHTHIYMGILYIMHTKKVNECAVTSERSVFFESRIVMSYPRCVESVSIRILWLSST